jgi:hypothetical protein
VKVFGHDDMLQHLDHGVMSRDAGQQLLLHHLTDG